MAEQTDNQLPRLAFDQTFSFSCFWIDTSSGAAVVKYISQNGAGTIALPYTLLADGIRVGAMRREGAIVYASPFTMVIEGVHADWPDDILIGRLKPEP